MSGKPVSKQDACKRCSLKNDCGKFGGCGLLKWELDNTQGTLKDYYNGEVIFNGSWHEIPFSSFGEEDYTRGIDEVIDYEDFSCFFEDMVSQRLEDDTQIFLDRLRGWSVPDLAVKFDTTQDCIRGRIRELKFKLKQALKKIDGMEQFKKALKRMKVLPKRYQYFFGMYLLNLTGKEIADYFGVSISAVNGEVWKTVKEVEKGRITLSLEAGTWKVKRDETTLFEDRWETNQE